MASTYTLISSQVLASSATSVTFSSIPGTYTDLVLRTSIRSNNSGTTDNISITLNGSGGTDYGLTLLKGNGSAGSSAGFTSYNYFSASQSVDGNNTTATNMFASTEIYIPSYASSLSKMISISSATEDNSSSAGFAYITADAGSWAGTSAITSIALAPLNGTNFLTKSSFYLYGI